MAKRFRQQGDTASDLHPVRSVRGGDESYHAPAGNPHADAGPRAEEGYRPAVSADPSHAGKKRLGANYVESDPYDIKGHRDPKRRRARIVSNVLLAIGLVLLAAAGGMWLYNRYQYHEQEVVNRKLAAYATVDDAGATPPEVDWASLKAVNADVVGWVQIPGTTVSYPVYQGKDNDQYLRTNAEGTYSVGGQVFLDAENAAPGMVDAQSVIYGHHLKDGSMFEPVAKLEDQNAFDAVQTVWYVTEDATYELQPLLAYKTDGDDQNVRRFTFDSDGAFRSYLAGLAAKAGAKAYGADDLIAGATRALSLCTCSYTGNETGRVILVCVPK